MAGIKTVVEFTDKEIRDILIEKAQAEIGGKGAGSAEAKLLASRQGDKGGAEPLEAIVIAKISFVKSIAK